ncbi:UPF0454 protein C12orf49 homolog [Pseudomyrmex gracilis]|uniref:UPF0454 protein C12orf49 homolog n=1 Tax=Pseudomyrmex gracilis TaxID=219809 RepID=UPI000995AFEB|nr:UPF0454 protein C12orf49 homolog [Pseudomyrmex gracilis]XP_020285977.1 UPF0454 protein C12orf49 homolog [Pseudomyrmex gracilis]
MPSCTGLIRIIRRRFVLGIIFALSLTYCIVSLLQNGKKIPLTPINNIDDTNLMAINDNEDLMPDENILSSGELAVPDKLPWQMEMLTGTNDNIENINLANLNENDDFNQSCRNSIQGKGLIVDERGLVCSRHEVLPNGCCTIEQTQQNKEDAVIKRERYSCKTCNLQGCCTIYEYCVSCCLNPNKSILQMRGRKDVNLIFLKVRKDEGETRTRRTDRFQICLAVCRTSSFSMRSVHENTYKDPLAKHCYVSQSLNSHQRRNINSLNNNGDRRVVGVTSSSVMTSLTRLSPECHLPYRLLNESRVSFSDADCLKVILILPSSKKQVHIEYVVR